MNAPRAHLSRTRRFGAGIAAAAVVTTGLACLGTAHAAELADFPQTLDFELRDLAATADDVYAVGYVGYVGIELDPNDEMYGFDQVDGYVEAVGTGVKLHLGDGTNASRVSASTDGEASIQRLGSAPVRLGGDVSPSDIRLLPRGEATDVVVAGNDWVEGPDGPDGPRVGQTTLRVVQGGSVGDKIVLGPDGGADQGVTGIDVDEVNGLVYVTTFRDMPDGPQEYGLNVIGGDVDEYYPADYPVSSVAVSADRNTVYLPGTGVSAYDTSDLASYSEENPAPAASIGSGWVGNATFDPNGRLYASTSDAQYDEETGEYLGSVTSVHAVEAPASRPVSRPRPRSGTPTRWPPPGRQPRTAAARANLPTTCSPRSPRRPSRPSRAHPRPPWPPR